MIGLLVNSVFEPDLLGVRWDLSYNLDGVEAADAEIREGERVEGNRVESCWDHSVTANPVLSEFKLFLFVSLLPQS